MKIEEDPCEFHNLAYLEVSFISSCIRTLSITFSGNGLLKPASENIRDNYIHSRESKVFSLQLSELRSSNQFYVSGLSPSNIGIRREKFMACDTLKLDITARFWPPTGSCYLSHSIRP